MYHMRWSSVMLLTRVYPGKDEEVHKNTTHSVKVNNHEYVG